MPVKTALQSVSLFQQFIINSETLTVLSDVQRPSSATSDSKLPVVFWIYGGGFNSGSTQVYDASNFISTSVAQGKDVIYVSVNYRVGGFGFLAGPELRKDGSVNLGHLDQRLGMEWVADNIAAFGGDPSRVTMWGESAGSISVFNQMTLYGGNNTYKGKPLFRGAIMDSGSVVPTDPVDCPKAQSIFNQVVAAGGCSGSSDTLACLRGLDYTTFLKATQQCPLHWTTQLLRSRTSLVPTGSSCQTPLRYLSKKETFPLFLSSSGIKKTKEQFSHCSNQILAPRQSSRTTFRLCTSTTLPRNKSTNS